MLSRLFADTALWVPNVGMFFREREAQLRVEQERILSTIKRKVCKQEVTEGIDGAEKEENQNI